MKKTPPGGPTATSGLDLQFALATRYLAEMLARHETDAPDARRVDQVRVEAPNVPVDDVVVTFGDGRTDYLQVKKAIEKTSPRQQRTAWAKLWRAFAAQTSRPDFDRGRDRVALVALPDPLLDDLERLVLTAHPDNCADLDEFLSRIASPVKLRDLFANVQALAGGDEAATWALLGCVDVRVELSAERIRRDAERELRGLVRDPASAFDVLYKRVVDGAVPSRIWTADAVRQELAASGHPILPPAERRPPIPFQAPPEVPNWVGREEETWELLAAFCQGMEAGRAPVAAITGQTRHTLAGLVGMAGIGKTALAIHLAHRLRDHYPDGVLWLRLRQPDGTPADLMRLLADVAAAYGLGEATEGQRTLEARAGFVRSLLARQRALLVLDDVVENHQLDYLLPGGETCAVLVTSRRTALPTLLGRPSIRLDRLPRDDAAALFHSALQDRNPQRLDAELEALAQIIELCDGLPLALAICAGWLAKDQRRPLSSLRARLADAQHRLDTLKHADKEVRAAFDLSYADLGEPLKRCFRRLAVFASPTFGAEAVAALLGLGDGTKTGEAEDLLAELLALSLLLPAEAHADRYRLHPLLADYAAEHLRAEDDEGAVRRAHARYFLTVAEKYTEEAFSRAEWAVLDVNWAVVGGGAVPGAAHGPRFGRDGERLR